jgi:hypothetical protein
MSAVRRGKKVDLSWSGTLSSQVLIRRNNTETLTTNDGSHTDTISGKGTFVYEVCETNLSSCSNRVTIVF